MRTYVDGTALSRYLDGAVEHAEWTVWADEHVGSLVTSELAISELRREAEPRGIDARQTARDVADRIAVVRFSDQCLATAAMASAVLPPFAALHLGVAVAEPGVAAAVASDATTFAVPFHVPLPSSPAYTLLDAGLDGVGLDRLAAAHAARQAVETTR